MALRRVFLVAALIALTGACGGGGGGSKINAEVSAPTQVAPTDWETATPESVGLPSATINQFLQDSERLASVRSVLLVRDGKLIGERYYNGGSSSTLYPIMSITKSVTSLLIGQAIDAGRISGISAPLSQLLPEALARTPGSSSAKLTLEQVLRMTTGNVWNEDDINSWDRWNAAADKTRFALELQNAGGAAYRYDTATSHLTSPILQQAHGGINVADIATRDLFGPLGITTFAWERDGVGVPFGSFGLKLRSRDLAKIGLMVLDGGMWKGKPVVPAAWIAESTPPRFILGPQGSMKNLGYGYLWWSGILGNKKISFGWGHGGQFVIMVPSHRLVIACNSFANVDRVTSPVQESDLREIIAEFLASLP